MNENGIIVEAIICDTALFGKNLVLKRKIYTAIGGDGLTLEDMLKFWGNRKITLCHELTKIHEEFRRTTFSEAIYHYEQNPPRGEFVLVVEGQRSEKEREFTFEQAQEITAEYIRSGLSLKDAARKAADKTGYSKNELYSAALKMEIV